MNAKQLYEVMKDVPPTAWPEGLEYGENKQEHGNDTCDFPIWSISVDGVSADILGDEEKWKGEPDDAEEQGEIHSLCPPQNAVQMCVGSMLAYLRTKYAQVLIGSCSQSQVFVNIPGHEGKWYGSEVEALAAMCKEARP
jgi:hypothetical protein